MPKTVAIVQSNYIPWKGYFDLIASSDEFIVLDTKYTHRDWRNRNSIKTPNGLQWLTVPVEGGGWVSDTRITDPRWGRQHWKAIECNYGKAPFFKAYKLAFEDIYSKPYEYLDDLNIDLLKLVCDLFKITTPINRSDCYPSKEARTKRLVEICRQTGATHYLTGPKASDYIDEALFGDIKVVWKKYQYKEYPQLHGGFVHNVSILDVIFNAGPKQELIRC